jgi:hypothetical protein
MTVSRLNRRQMLIQSAAATLALTGCRRSFRVRGDPAWVWCTLRQKQAPNSA